MTKVEEVARAIWGEWSLWASPITKPKPSWDDLAEGNKDLGRRMARAAIAAMREPTAVMIEVGNNYTHCGGSCGNRAGRDTWQAMIDAALNEKDPT